MLRAQSDKQKEGSAVRQLLLLIFCYAVGGAFPSLITVAIFIKTRELTDNEIPLAQSMLVVYYIGAITKPLWAKIAQFIRAMRPYKICNVLWLVIFFLLLASGSATMIGHFDITLFAFTGYMITVNAATAGLEIIVDGFLCRIVKQQNKLNYLRGARVQSLCWASRFFLTGICQLLGGVLTAKHGTQQTFRVYGYAVVVQAVAVVLLVCNEKRSVTESQTAQQRNGWVGMYAPILAFVFFYHFGASIDPIYNYWAMDKGNLTEVSLASINFLRYVGLAVGAAVYTRVKFFRSLSKLKFLVFGHILQSVTALFAFLQLLRVTMGTSFWEWKDSDTAFMLFNGFITAVLSGIITIPVEHLAASNTVEGEEEFMYSVFTVVAGSAMVISEIIGAGLAVRLGVSEEDYSNLPLLYGECLSFGAIFVVSVILLPKNIFHNGFERIENELLSDTESESEGEGDGVDWETAGSHEMF